MPTDNLMPLEDDELEPALRKPRRGGSLAGLAILLALGAAGMSGWMWWQSRDSGAGPELESRLANLQQRQERQGQDLASLDARLEAATAEDDGPGLEALESAQSELRAQIRALEEALESQQSYARTLQQAIESTQARILALETSLAAQAPARLDAPAQLDLAAVEYLLRLAPERLTLFHDLRSADQALALADLRLEAMDNPIHVGLRRAIADARQALADTDLPNPVEISTQLDSVQANLGKLGFGDARSGASGPPAAEEEPADPDLGWWARLKASLAGLVTVRRNADEAASRLTLEDKDMLRQGLWMQIEAARLAVMRHDQAAWEDSLGRAVEALERWFDRSSSEFSAIRDGLETLSRLNIAPELPDISGPWAQLQLIRQVRTTAPPDEPE